MERFGALLLELSVHLVRVQVEGRDPVGAHAVHEELERNAGELGGLGEGEPPLADLVEEPELAKLLGELVGLPGMMGERFGRELPLPRQPLPGGEPRDTWSSFSSPSAPTSPAR
jgi:hypothetical protein